MRRLSRAQREHALLRIEVRRNRRCVHRAALGEKSQRRDGGRAHRFRQALLFGDSEERFAARAKSRRIERLGLAARTRRHIDNRLHHRPHGAWIELLYDFAETLVRQIGVRGVRERGKCGQRDRPTFFEPFQKTAGPLPIRETRKVDRISVQRASPKLVFRESPLFEGFCAYETWRRRCIAYFDFAATSCRSPGPKEENRERNATRSNDRE